jgi:hypothetical protein
MYIERAITSDMASLSRGVSGDKSAKPSTGKARDWSVDTDTTGFVRKALSLPLDVPASAIEKARMLVEAGQLDAPAAIRQAASAIADLGI